MSSKPVNIAKKSGRHCHSLIVPRSNTGVRPVALLQARNPGSSNVSNFTSYAVATKERICTDSIYAFVGESTPHGIVVGGIPIGDIKAQVATTILRIIMAGCKNIKLYSDTKYTANVSRT